MFTRYIVTILPIGKPVPPPVTAGEHQRLVMDVGSFRVVVEAAGRAPVDALAFDTSEMPQRLTITEGTIIPAGADGPLQSGTYNQLIIDAGGTARIHNDTFGMLAAYYAQTGDVLRISNSLRLLAVGAGLAWDELGIVETFLYGGWTPSDRTILAGGRRLPPGSEYTFDLHQDTPPTGRRLTNTWTTVVDDSLDETVDRICELWEAAISRHIDPIGTPIGVMLSGGLDSRMVAGAIASRGKQLIGLTFGDLDSDEVRIAGEVAALTHAEWIPSGLDADFPFERFAFDRVNRTNETLYNLMWDANLPLMAAKGATHYTTGATFETILGGQRDADQQRRMLRNLRNAVIGPWQTSPATAAELAEIIENQIEKARKRARNYAFLLTEPYRSMMTDRLPDVREEVAHRIHTIAAAGPISTGQIIERYDSEYYQTQHSRDQERQLLTYGELTLPTCDRDFANYVTNVSAGMKYDHALYYRVIRRLYPQLAAVQVPNLGTGVNSSQLQIEIIRAWRIQRNARLTSWVNFSKWMTLNDNLEKYAALFLNQPHFFDSAALETYFEDVRAGRKGLYDGSETAGYLNLAMLLDERRLTA